MLKNYFLPALAGLLLLPGLSGAQTVLYSEDFETNDTGYTLNTADQGGETSLSPNYWIVNNAYQGGDLFDLGFIIIPDVPNQPAALSANPQSNYLHIVSEQAASDGINNANYDASGTHSYFAAQNGSINTTGTTNDTLSFWWLCDGGNNSYGEVYYRTSATGTWTALPDHYHNNDTGWALKKVYDAAFDNQAYLQFGFRFRHNSAGNDPAFAVDAVKLTSSAGAEPAPVVALSVNDDTLCAGDCATLTGSVMNNVTSYSWNASGSSDTSETGTYTLQACYDMPGTYQVIFTANGPGGTASDTETIVVVANPTPQIVLTGGSFTVTGGPFTMYEWHKNSSVISGANGGIYTPASSGYYQVLVSNAAGCTALSDSVYFTATSVAAIAPTPGGLWISDGVLHTTATGKNILGVTILDAQGKIVQAIQSVQNNRMVVLPAGLPQGLYIVQVQCSDYTRYALKWIQ